MPVREGSSSAGQSLHKRSLFQAYVMVPRNEQASSGRRRRPRAGNEPIMTTICGPLLVTQATRKLSAEGMRLSGKIELGMDVVWATAVQPDRGRVEVEPNPDTADGKWHGGQRLSVLGVL